MLVHEVECTSSLTILKTRHAPGWLSPCAMQCVADLGSSTNNCTLVKYKYFCIPTSTSKSTKIAKYFLSGINTNTSTSEDRRNGCHTIVQGTVAIPVYHKFGM